MKLISVKLAVILFILGETVVNGLAEDKIKTTPEEIANVLHYYLQKDMREFENSQEFKIFTKDIKNPEIFKREVYFLKVFSFDLGIMKSEHEEFLKDKIRKTFLKMVSESDFYMQNRFHAYITASNSPHHLGPAWTVGKAFANFCDYTMDAVVIGWGGIVFTHTYSFVYDSLKMFQIKL